MKYYLIALGGACADTEMRTALLCKVNALHSCRRTVRGNARCSHFSGHYLRNRSTLDIGVLGYIGIV